MIYLVLGNFLKYTPDLKIGNFLPLIGKKKPNSTALSLSADVGYN